MVGSVKDNESQATEEAVSVMEAKLEKFSRLYFSFFFDWLW